jgi:ferredoxin
MAVIRFEDVEREVPDNSRIQRICEEMGMPFGCTEGLCGTCRCVVVSGMENLEPRNEKEEDMDLEDDERLACQCIIRTGTVEFTIG